MIVYLNIETHTKLQGYKNLYPGNIVGHAGQSFYFCELSIPFLQASTVWEFYS